MLFNLHKITCSEWSLEASLSDTSREYLQHKFSSFLNTDCFMKKKVFSLLQDCQNLVILFKFYAISSKGMGSMEIAGSLISIKSRDPAPRL